MYNDVFIDVTDPSSYAHYVFTTFDHGHSGVISFEVGIHYVVKGDLSPLYSMNKFVTNKLKLPQDGAQVFPYIG